MAFRATALLAAAAAAAAGKEEETCAQIDFKPSGLAPIDPALYASWNVDSSRNRAFFDTDWSGTQLAYLAAAIGGGGRIRFGGSGNDLLNWGGEGASCPRPGIKTECLNQSWAEGLFGLAQSSNQGLVFGLNIHPADSGPSPPTGPWNATNAAALLRWSLARGTPPLGLELGNEQNTIMTAAEQAAAFKVLSQTVDEVFASAPPGTPRPVLVGPDVHGFHNATDAAYNGPVLAYLAHFAGNMSASGVPLAALTHHEYIEIDQSSALSPAYLDNTLSIGRQVVAAVRAVSPDVPIWAGEIGPHNGDGNTSLDSTCDGNHVCGRWGSTLWYADALGAKASVGYSGFMRQDLIGADYALINASLPGPGQQLFPTPDYYLLKVWREAMVAAINMSHVLSASLPPASPATTRAYAFCGEGTGQAAVVLLNLDPASSDCVLPYAGGEAPPPAGSTMRVYTMTPEGGDGVAAASALLNGSPLALDAQGRLPSFAPLLVPVGSLTLPPLSVTIAVVPLAAGSGGVCGA